MIRRQLPSGFDPTAGSWGFLRLLVAALVLWIVSGGGARIASQEVEGYASPPLRQGINCDPSWLRTDPEALISMPLQVEIRGEHNGTPIVLFSDYAASVAGISFSGPGAGDSPFDDCRDRADDGPEPRIECAIRIFRFLQFGSGETSADFDWLMELAERSGTLWGSLTATRGKEADELVFPGQLRLTGEVILTLRRQESSTVLRLRNRKPLTLEGTVRVWPPTKPVWPPYSVPLQLVNGPIAFFPEDRLGDPEAMPYLVVQRILAVFGTQPTEFFSYWPEITKLSVVDPSGTAWRSGPIGGVTLTWTPTTLKVRGPTITHYNLYRNARPGDPTGWQLFARVPADKTTAVDTLYRGRSSVEYLVTHGTDCPFDHRYEGVYGLPALMDPVLKPER